MKSRAPKGGHSDFGIFMKTVLLIAVLLLAANAHSQTNQVLSRNAKSHCSGLLRISVFDSGKWHADSSVTNMQSLESLLRRKPILGETWVYFESDKAKVTEAGRDIQNILKSNEVVFCTAKTADFLNCDK